MEPEVVDAEADTVPIDVRDPGKVPKYKGLLAVPSQGLLAAKSCVLMAKQVLNTFLGSTGLHALLSETRLCMSPTPADLKKAGDTRFASNYATFVSILDNKFTLQQTIERRDAAPDDFAVKETVIKAVRVL